MDKNYESLNDFQLKWRFIEEEYNKLSREELEKIKPLSRSYSREYWDQRISDKVGHYMRIDVGDKKNVTLRNNCGWGEVKEENETVEFLKKSLKVNEGNKIIFFWNRNNSVETTWGFFLKYWTDFCYPSDDSNIIIIEGYEEAVIYIEDRIMIVNRKEYFS